MPVISDHWEKFTEEDWRHIAEQYLLEISERSKKSDTDQEIDDEDDKDESWGVYVTEFEFSSSPELQWEFILLALSLAETDEQLGDIAAGGIEHLLGWHGEYIKNFEEEFPKNPKLAKALTGVWKYMMTDEVWERVQKMQLRVEDKLL